MTRKKPGWDDFLSSFDQAQPDVVIQWAKKPRQNTPDPRQYFKNRDAFYGGTGPKKPADPPPSNLSQATQDRIRKLETLGNDPRTPKHEAESALRMAAKLRQGGK